MRPLDRRQLPKTSLEITSSFFWSSPDWFERPARPFMSARLARCTREAICLQARPMEEMTVANSPSTVPFCSSYRQQTCMLFLQLRATSS